VRYRRLPNILASFIPFRTGSNGATLDSGVFVFKFLELTKLVYIYAALLLFDSLDGFGLAVDELFI
jgi:hypothetical protein